MSAMKAEKIQGHLKGMNGEKFEKGDSMPFIFQEYEIVFSDQQTRPNDSQYFHTFFQNFDKYTGENRVAWKNMCGVEII